MYQNHFKIAGGQIIAIKWQGGREGMQKVAGVRGVTKRGREPVFLSLLPLIHLPPPLSFTLSLFLYQKMCVCFVVCVL